MQRPYTTRSVIACVLALSAATPSFSQTAQGSAFAPERRSGGPAATADHSAGLPKSISRWNEAARSGAHLAVPLNDLTTPTAGASTPTHHGGRTATPAVGTSDTPDTGNSSGTSSGGAELERSLESLRARLAVLIDARLAAVVADAARVNVAPLTVDRGQLMRASLAGNLRASYWLLQHPELLLGPAAASAYRSATFAPGEQERALRLALYHRLILQAGSVEVLEAFDVLGHAQADLGTGWLDAPSALRALLEIELACASTPLAREARTLFCHR